MLGKGCDGTPRRGEKVICSAEMKLLSSSRQEQRGYIESSRSRMPEDVWQNTSYSLICI